MKAHRVEEYLATENMGVTGLWTVVQPCARPIKLETLNKKRLAVDASIWIYQFLKAVRDKEGNALRNSHVVGFFRRICKLLFFGIKPVFVFDGGAPILKRQTVSGRKARREGRREDAVRTAGKLLAVQMQRRAEEDERKRREERERPAQDEEEPVPENMVYVDELQMTAEERKRNRTFKKKDAYHLPNLDVDLADMGAPNDPRIMSHEELEEYARQFHTGEDVNIYDFSKIDYDSPFFVSLPASDRYNILNAARLRSRLRMGHSKEQLDTMFPNRMDFSRFQIERVKERNELTQRLMNINGMNGEDAMFGINNPGRVAGERGKEYVLVKNDGVEGGWALGVVSNKGEGERNKPINVDDLDKQDDEYDERAEDASEDDGFEDVPIEGLNRLPQRQDRAESPTQPFPSGSEEMQKRRKAVYEAQRKAAGFNAQAGEAAEEEADSLFLPQNGSQASSDNDDHLFEDVQSAPNEEDEDLNRAIAMSLQQEDASGIDAEEPSFAASAKAGPRIDQPLDFNQKNAKVGRDAAHLINARANRTAPQAFSEDSEDESNLDLQAALQESRRSKHKPHSGPRVHDFKRPDAPGRKPAENAQRPVAKPSGHVSFDGPLPFESLNLGKSILGAKKKQPAVEEAGGFEKDSEKEKPAQPLPPWFSGDIREEAAKQKAIEGKQFEGDQQDSKSHNFAQMDRAAILRRQQTSEVIDLDAPKITGSEPIVVDDGDSENDAEDIDMSDVKPIDSEVRMGDIADLARVEPPISEMPNSDHPPVSEMPNSNHLNGDEGSLVNGKATPASSDQGAKSVDDLDWSDSDHEDPTVKESNDVKPQEMEEPAGGQIEAEGSKSPSPEFENVGIMNSPIQPPQEEDTIPIPILQQGDSIDDHFLDDIKVEENDFSDPEDEDLLRSLAAEADEHARFAATLNNRTQLQNAEDYERELRQLRNQQRKDRRDADEVTHIMITECQQLLQLFGLPYITAPMEAEAQCAELVSLGLVDGIVTDDSDIFLFGGTRVYKNMFNQSKFVECYLAADLEKEYALTRQKLIRFAHLLGSDYTEGLPSVGPVTALEILSEFTTLEAFADWWTAIQSGITLTSTQPNPPDSSSFRKKFRKNASKLFLPPNFPDTRVDLAYLSPEVDSDPQPFQWGVPDLDRLRTFLMATIGWSQDRTDEVLVPVIKDMNRRDVEGTQANITQFFQGAVGVGAGTTQRQQQQQQQQQQQHQTGNDNEGEGSAPRRRGGVGAKSKRMETALSKMQDRARRLRMADHGEGESGNEAAGRNDDDSSNTTAAAASMTATQKTRQTQGRKKRKKREIASEPEPEPGQEGAEEEEPEERRSNGITDDADIEEDEDDDEDDDEEYRASTKSRRKKQKKKT